MNFLFTYEPDSYQRIMFAIIVDNRANIPAIKNAIGTAIKDYVDSQTALVTENTLFYKIESNNGNLAGYFVLGTTDNGAGLNLFMVRPSFSDFAGEIVEQLLNFIQTGAYNADKL